MHQSTKQYSYDYSIYGGYSDGVIDIVDKGYNNVVKMVHDEAERKENTVGTIPPKKFTWLVTVAAPIPT